jgi:hypothetical protein
MSVFKQKIEIEEYDDLVVYNVFDIEIGEYDNDERDYPRGGSRMVYLIESFGKWQAHEIKTAGERYNNMPGYPSRFEMTKLLFEEKTKEAAKDGLEKYFGAIAI